MSMTRYEACRQVVIQESNAIGTTYLRSRMFPEPQRSEIAALMGRYVSARLDMADAGKDKERVRKTREDAVRIQSDLWSRAVDLAKKYPQVVPTGLFIQSLNDVIDLDTKRQAALENHVPESVIIVLYIVSIISIGLVGCAHGMSGRRNAASTLTLTLLIAVVITLIVDLDRPRRGLIRVSQQSMENLDETFFGGDKQQ